MKHHRPARRGRQPRLIERGRSTRLRPLQPRPNHSGKRRGDLLRRQGRLAGQGRYQLGGGIRDLKAVETWLKAGIERVVLGTAALHDPALVKSACRAFPGRIAVGIDGREGRVAVRGWVEQTDMTVLELGQSFEDAGVAAIIFTDISRDGVMAGVNIAAIKAFAKSVSTPVIASGGVASLDDLRAVKALEQDGVIGVIAGRAFYDGQLDVGAALKLVAA